MRWPSTEIGDVIDWHNQFALFPTKVGRTWIWLETINRRLTRIEVMGGDGEPVPAWSAEYREQELD